VTTLVLDSERLGGQESDLRQKAAKEDRRVAAKAVAAKDNPPRPIV